jgi:menaquinone-dependent protoporphyrinogen oxidase
MNVLVTAASRQGSTREIAEAIARTLRKSGLDVTVEDPDAVIDVSGYDAFVIGSALYMGRWLEPATELVRRLAPTLGERQVWLFSSGPVGDPRRKLVQKMATDPVELPQLLALTAAREHRLFAGKLVGQGLTVPRRLSLVLVRGLEGDWRDWTAIERWASAIAVALATSPAVRGPHASPEHVG